MNSSSNPQINQENSIPVSLRWETGRVALFPFRSGVMLVWLLLNGILVSPFGHAQENVETDYSAPAATALPEMTVTASREERASFDVPRAVTVIGREALERQSPTVLPDLLRGQAGVFV